MTSFVLSTRLVWCVRVSLRIQRLRSVSESLMVSNAHVHAYNKLNAATIPAQTPIPRKDALQNNMDGCTMFSALDFVV